MNAHSTLWHSYTDDHRGQLIADVISNSDHITLNTNTPTRVPNTTLLQTSSPDITTVSNTLYNWTSWTTQHALSSDHLPIITTINIRHDYRLQQNRSLGSHAQHTHYLEDHTWSIQQSTTTHTKHIHNIQQKIATTPKHIANCFTKQFTNTVKHATHKTNRHINRATHNIQGYNITLTTSQVQEAIKQSKNNNSQGPDKLNIRHLKHIDPLRLAFLTSMFKTVLNNNIIPHTWKLANIIHIPKPYKDTYTGIISFLSVIAKILEKSLLPYITANIPNTPMQHGFKTHQSTVTALHTLNNTVAKGFNQMAPPARTITVALNMSKAFDTINIHTLIRKLLETNIQAQSLSSSQTTSSDVKLTQHEETTQPDNVNLKFGIPQVGVLSPTLFNIYTSDLPPPSAPVQVMAYADDITSTHKHECRQEVYTTIPTYSFCLDKTKQSHTKSRQNNLHSVHARPCRIYEQSGPQNTQHCTTHGNAPKGSGSYLRPKTHIHPQHISTRTQTSINHKRTHCNRMG